MNQEAVFALRFVVKDVAKITKALEKTNKMLEDLRKKSNKANKSFDKMNTSMGKATKTLLRFAGAYFTLSKIVGTVFNKAREAIQEQTMATTAGVHINQIRKMGKALKAFGGDAKSAGSAYASLTNIIGGATHGLGISQDVQRVNAMYGIGFNYGNISQDQLITEIATSMHRLRGNKDQWAINQIASAYGLDDSMSAMLAKYGKDWKKHVSKQEIDKMQQSEAQRLIMAQENLETKLNNLIIKLEPLLSKIVEGLGVIADWIYAVWGSRVEKRKAEETKNANYEKHKGEFLDWGQSQPKKTGWFSDEYTTTLTTIPKGTELERAQHILDKIKENKFNTNVIQEYLHTGEQLAKDYGESFGFKVGMLPQSDGSKTVYVQVGSVTVQDNSGTLKGKTNAVAKGLSDSISSVPPTKFK